MRVFLYLRLAFLILVSFLLDKKGQTIYAQEKLEGKIAVLQLVNQSGLRSDEISYLTNEVQATVQLRTKGYYQVMTQENILQLLPPEKSLEDCIGECEVQTGRSLGAALLVTGQMFKFGTDKDQLRLALRLHETQNGTLISTVTIKGINPTAIEGQLKTAVDQLISDGLRDIKEKELENKLGRSTASDRIQGNTEDLSKQLDALNQMDQKEEQRGTMDYEAELKALEIENQKKRAHQNQVDLEWKKVLVIVDKGKTSISKQALMLFINQYNQHPFGNHRLEEAGNLLKKVSDQEEKDKKNALEKAHLSKVKISYEAAKKYLSKGDEQGKKALDLLIEEFKNHPLGNPLEDEAKTFYEEAKERKENEERERHLNMVRGDWEKAKKLVEAGDEKASKALDLFLKKYKDHTLGNPLENEAKGFFEERKAQREKVLKENHQHMLDAEWERLSKAMTAGGPTAVKTVELFLKKYASHPLGNPYQGEAENALADLRAGREVRAGGNSGISWILINGGTFMMGSKEEGYYELELPVHRVKVKNFYMSKTEVTVGQYRKCVEAGVCSEPDDKNAHSNCNWGYSDRDGHPINCVDWTQARAFAKWVGGDLPSEAQWEYAARSGGRDIKYPWGNEKASCEYAVMGNPNDWEDESMRGCGQKRTWEVCSKTGGNTAQGLCDMGGNVLEWVLDEWHDSYSGAPADDRGWCSDRGCSSNTSADRVRRGGGWNADASDLRSAYRFRNWPGIRHLNLGFRVSRSVN